MRKKQKDDHLHQRPPNRPDGSTAVTATEESGGDPPPVGAAGPSAQNSRSKPATDRGERSFGHPGSTGGGEPQSPSRCRPKVNSPTDSLGVFQKRSIFHLPYRRSSSGYFSFESDSLPSSPLSPRPATADKATQTPSPTGQVISHALQRMAEAHGGGPGTHQQHGISPSPSSTRQQNAAGDMQAEAIGRELRLIGDDYNRVLMLRGVAGGRRRIVIHPNQLPYIQQEPTVLLCVGILLLLIGRIIYSQGSTNGHQDHSQV
ncbi:bcl-2-like protein 11 isoform X1 [Thunnus albacares]|uniref:bcl-2-like protein 11 isoform X1 n=1 Tax=Thunnus maccoyii TaxID=8240 RepID=UPI001C4C728D|nr:bcl-2-like protein 11 isoform X1 [Thunnus maccoyii]XP_044228632.1 bcl-2-like protein 11 isoform X1 [Thunnus albacares]